MTDYKKETNEELLNVVYSAVSPDEAEELGAVEDEALLQEDVLDAHIEGEEDEE